MQGEIAHPYGFVKGPRDMVDIWIHLTTPKLTAPLSFHPYNHKTPSALATTSPPSFAPATASTDLHSNNYCFARGLSQGRKKR